MASSNDQEPAHGWATLVQTQPYLYPNCWGDRVDQFRSQFSDIASDRAWVLDAVDAFPHVTLYQLLAGRVAVEPLRRLKHAKRAFWQFATDRYVQEEFLAACAFYLRREEHDVPLRSPKFVCSRPFETIEIGLGGAVTPCCSGWLPTLAGAIPNSSIDEIWRGPVMTEIRRKISTLDYSSCSRLLCPYFHDGNREVHRKHSLYEPTTVDYSINPAPPHPKSLHLCYDSSCNLSCPSCRTSTFVAGSAARSQMDATLLPQIREALPHLQRIWITGSGDPFASKHFRQILELLKAPEHRHIVIDLQTNGVLFDANAWQTFEFQDRLGVVIVSIDAGTPETYSIVRRGGDFRRLMNNLEFLAGKRRSGQMCNLRLDAVIQRFNFEEIPRIVDIARKMAFDSCFFSTLTNWGHLSFEEFEQAFVFAPDHEDYDAMASLYRELKDDPFIDWGNLPLWFEGAQDEQVIASVSGPRVPVPPSPAPACP